MISEFHRRLLELNGGAWFDFEPHLATFYRAILRPGSIAVDGGANLGLHTFQMAQAVQPDGLVIAIEPIPDLQSALHTHLHEYHLPEKLIRLVPCGLFSTPGEADFYQVLHPIHHEMSSLHNRQLFEGQEVKQIRIELTTLDTACKDLQRLDFVKLDLEGAEMEALRGGRLTLSRYRPVIAIEQDAGSPQRFGYTWNNLFEYFASLGYEIYDLFGLRYTEAEMFDQCAVWDFLGLPAERPNKDDLFNAVRYSMEATGVKFDLTAGSQVDPPAAGASRELQCSELPSASFFDFIGPVEEPTAQASVHVPRDTRILFSGWAIDEPGGSVAGGVDVVVDKVPYGAMYGRHRSDIADHFNNKACENSGFFLFLPPGTLSPGQHVAALHVISYDKKSYYQGSTIEFTVD